MGMLNRPEIERRMGFHPATDATRPVFEANRAAVIELAEQWDETLPAGRELAEALTCLQTALMWANAAVACETPLEGGYHSRSRPPLPPDLATVPLDDHCSCGAHQTGLGHARWCEACPS